MQMLNYKYMALYCLYVMQETKACQKCGNESPEYKCSDRHRGYYDCECGESITVDYYA